MELLGGFDDLPSEVWTDLLARSEAPCVFLTRTWMETWWRALGAGRLILLAATRDGYPLALAPLHTHDGVTRFLGTDSADYLDFLGDTSEPVVLESLLAAARDATGTDQFRLTVIPEHSPTSSRLRAAAGRLTLTIGAEEPMPAPWLDDGGLPHAARRRSLLRHTRWFERQDPVTAIHTSQPEEIAAHLDDFFRQHVERCTIAPYASLFEDPRQREFYRQLALSGADWLRFTRIEWRGHAIAYHFGMCFRGSFLWYKPSFELALAARSPGEVLLRHLLVAAHEEGARTFDFGIGDEAFKYRFATSVGHVRTWTLA